VRRRTHGPRRGSRQRGRGPQPEPDAIQRRQRQPGPLGPDVGTLRRAAGPRSGRRLPGRLRDRALRRGRLVGDRLRHLRGRLPRWLRGTTTRHGPRRPRDPVPL